MFNAFSIVTFEVLFLLLNVMLLNACFERALHCELHCPVLAKHRLEQMHASNDDDDNNNNDGDDCVR